MKAALILSTDECFGGYPHYFGERCDFRCPEFSLCPLGASRDKLVPIAKAPAWAREAISAPEAAESGQ